MLILHDRAESIRDGLMIVLDAVAGEVVEMEDDEDKDEDLVKELWWKVCEIEEVEQILRELVPDENECIEVPDWVITTISDVVMFIQKSIYVPVNDEVLDELKNVSSWMKNDNATRYVRIYKS